MHPIIKYYASIKISIYIHECNQNFKKNVTNLEEQCHKSKNAHLELFPQKVCLRPYLPSGIAPRVYIIKLPLEGSSVVFILMRLHRPGQWFLFSPKSYIF
jgi:hypothetical protein